MQLYISIHVLTTVGIVQGNVQAHPYTVDGMENGGVPRRICKKEPDAFVAETIIVIPKHLFVVPAPPPITH